MASDNSPQTVYDRLFRYAEMLGFGDLHMKVDRDQGLFAVIAVHNTTLGPAIGGCRCIPYASVEDALKDSLRLARMMTYKAAIHNLPHGGAKSVLMRPKHIQDPDKYFSAFGQFIESLGGRYITAIDSGTTPKEMDIIAKHTSYVACTTEQMIGFGDTADFTALGVCRGIQAAVKHKLGKDTLDGVHVAIQGAGNVGYFLAHYLTERNAKLTMTDTNPEKLQRCVDEYGVNTVEPDAIYDVECDVFSPCALGAVLNAETIRRLKCAIVAGSANNQLAHVHHGVLLEEHGILYAPDFVINAGGLIQVASIYDHTDYSLVKDRVSGIYETTLSLFEEAEKSHTHVHCVAEKIAEQRFNQKPKDSISYEKNCNV